MLFSKHLTKEISWVASYRDGYDIEQKACKYGDLPNRENITRFSLIQDGKRISTTHVGNDEFVVWKRRTNRSLGGKATVCHLVAVYKRGTNELKQITYVMDDGNIEISSHYLGHLHVIFIAPQINSWEAL